jgi:carbohydrate-selective porin OprB
MLCHSPQAHSQVLSEETLSGPDSHEAAQRAHLLGDWSGTRSRLEERGVKLDFQYIADHLWNTRSARSDRFASWNRLRGTVDLDLGLLANVSGMFFHATAVWQGGGNLGQYLGLLTSPSGMSSQGTSRLDSWWLEKRSLQERLTLRVGQFAGQDFYGTQHYAASFVFEPMGYAFGNLFTTYESFDPPSTPAVEVRVAPVRHVYAKSMVFATDRDPYAHNPTGLVPQFRGAPMTVSEVGFTPGETASAVRAFDRVEERRGYSGLYRFGGGYNPTNFTIPGQSIARRGDFLLYWTANQALWRVDPQGSKGIDATLSYDWSPANVNRNDTQMTVGVRFNEPLSIAVHNTLSIGYVRNHLTAAFAAPDSTPFKVEHGFEVNALVDVARMMYVQPVLQYFVNAGGSEHGAVVFGLRTKVDF